MKITHTIITLLLPAILTIVATACGDGDKPVGPTELPVAAKTFISTYYPGVEISSAYEDKKDGDYTARLANGHEVEFNAAGDWVDVDAPVGQTVPYGFYPTAIDTYLAENAGGIGINEISREGIGYEVELLDGRDLLFGHDGTYIGPAH